MSIRGQYITEGTRLQGILPPEAGEGMDFES
jgi:hypothetical protein